MGERSLKQEAAAMEAKAAALRAAPHVIYGAKVYKTTGDVTCERRWTCGLMYEGVTYNQFGASPPLGSPSWYYSFPCAFGPSPEAACEAFDRLWAVGDLEPAPGPPEASAAE